jgi:hypothetical protein
MNDNDTNNSNANVSTESVVRTLEKNRSPLLVLRCDEEELQIHEARLDSIKECLWRQ